MSDDLEVRTVAAVERAFAILEAFNQDDITLSLAELAERTGLYKSTILRLIQTLERVGYIGRTAGGDYHIGPRPLRLGRLYQRAVSKEDVIMPALQRLVEVTTESAGFHVRFNDRRLCLYRVDSQQPLRDHFKPGDELPLGRGAAGVVLSAFTEPDDARFADVRQDMVAVSRGTLWPDMGGVAAPVFNADGKLEGALTVSGPATRFDDAAVAQFKPILLSSARDVTAALGGDISMFERALGKPR
ncbi:MAG: IclR family transcriptional regulator [Pseudomonadota bacterium]